MNNTNPPTSEQMNKPPERHHDTAGMMLRKGRENANLTHAAVSEALHLTVHYIKALENDDHGKLPGATFVKGYLRTYARFLKLDVNAVLASYERNKVSAEDASDRTESQYRIQKRHDQTFRWAMVTAVIIVGGVAAGWWFVGKDDVRTATETANQQVPAEAPAERATATAQDSAVQTSAGISRPAYSLASMVSGADAMPFSQASGAGSFATTQALSLAPGGIETSSASAGFLAAAGATSIIDAAVEHQSTPALTSASGPDDIALTVTPTAEGGRQVTLISAGADVVQLYFKGASWVEIGDGASGRLYNETLNTGDAMTLHGTAPFQVLLGDASQVELTYNSEPISLETKIRGDKTARFLLGAADVSQASDAASGVIP